jgi:hypothetical protein
MVEDAYNLYAL